MVSGQRVVTRLPSPLEVKREREETGFVEKHLAAVKGKTLPPDISFLFEEKERGVRIGEERTDNEVGHHLHRECKHRRIRDKAFALE
ncbi:hypothetical protein CDAR_278461 [Caerostris darwini]|uniref:Uncharacterized protein n=1 Tax=Caerostris darwini TaxID=1538125 RepID=A0AAV4WS79_9ARAC|nr:hypothetical protein CDAR_278461 [Caerostris darwini]